MGDGLRDMGEGSGAGKEGSERGQMLNSDSQLHSGGLIKHQRHKYLFLRATSTPHRLLMRHPLVGVVQRRCGCLGASFVEQHNKL